MCSAPSMPPPEPIVIPAPPPPSPSAAASAESVGPGASVAAVNKPSRRRGNILRTDSPDQGSQDSVATGLNVPV